MNKQNKNISIIMPAYNTENYIAKSIKSVQSQSFSNWELIIIDDGSTDSTKKIAQSFAQEDSRIQVVSQKNSGVSIARNWGISHAKGEYICFLDSDDLWSSSFLQDTIKVAVESNYPVVYAGYDLYDIDKNWVRPEQKPEYFEGNILHRYLLNFYICCICSVLIKREALLKTGILFSANHIYGEDTEFFIKLFSQLEVGNTNSILFKYCKRPGSATTSKSFYKYISIVHAYIDALRFLDKNYFKKDRTEVLAVMKQNYIYNEIKKSQKIFMAENKGSFLKKLNLLAQLN